MNTDTGNTELIRRYLLDALNEVERSAVEERFFTDDNAFDYILAVEDELFFEYQEGELDPGERLVFERKFLTTGQDRDRAAFAAALIEASADLSRERSSAAAPVEEKVSLLRSLVGFFNFGSALQFGMAAAGLLLAVGVIGLLVQNSRLNSDLAAVQGEKDTQRRDLEAELAKTQNQQRQIETQLEAERDKAASSETRINELESQRKSLEDEIERRRDRVERSRASGRSGLGAAIATLVLSPGQFTRSDGQPMDRVVLSAEQKSLRLTLILKNTDEYRSFGFVLRPVDADNVILTRSNLSTSGKGTKRSLTLNIPARALARADYEISLRGISKTGEAEDIATYYFSVDKR